MAQINPQILTWARETAGLSIEDAAKKVGLSKTKSQTPAERLRSLESGDVEPSFSVLQKMAQKYRRPLVVFYLEQPPQKGIGAKISGPIERVCPVKKKDCLMHYFGI